MRRVVLTAAAVGLILTAAIAVSQTSPTLSARFDGLVHSTDGGFKFPDGSVQASAVVVSPASSVFAFVGVTTPVAGSTGVLTKTQACQTEFGAGVRMCDSQEILKTVDVPPASAWKSGQGWVQPVIRSAVVLNSAIFVIDASSSLAARACYASNSGLVVAESGGTNFGTFGTESCSDATTGVACCAPMS